jgi:hypothetical protein
MTKRDAAKAPAELSDLSNGLASATEKDVATWSTQRWLPAVLEFHGRIGPNRT